MRARRLSASPPPATSRGWIAAIAAFAAVAGIGTIAPPPGGAALSGPTQARDSVLGRSAEGAPIRVTRIGAPTAPVKVLVIGAIHGNETAGLSVTSLLRRQAPAIPGAELWIVPTINPDGVAAESRHNADGVDLNRNFPDGWRAGGRPGDTYYPGARPFSEPESRLIARLIRRLHPAATVWYHQALDLVDLGTAGDPGLVRRYARLSGLPTRRLDFLPGVATRWQNHLTPGGSAFVVELPAGALSTTATARHARAVRETAAYLVAVRSR